MGYPVWKPVQFTYEYDFAVSGGAQGNIDLVNKGINALSVDTVITGFTLYVNTTLTSGGSATITLGNSADRDGYYVDFFAAAAAGTVLRAGQAAGALLWDNTNDNELMYKPASAAASIPSITIGTADLTAGKFKVVFDCIRMA
jgi:hypothetical protein